MEITTRGYFFMGMLHQQYRFWVWHLQFDEPPNDRWIWRCFKCGGHSQNHRVVLGFCGKCSPQTWQPKKPKAYPQIGWRQHRKTSYLGWSIFWRTSFLRRFSELNLWISKKYAHKGEVQNQPSGPSIGVSPAICDHLDHLGMVTYGNHGRLWHSFTLQ